MPSITLVRADLDTLGPRWRALEARADGSFFQGWTWVGCLAERRFPDPVLLEAREGGRTVGLALFNRRRGPLGAEALWLGESGDPALDAVFVEYNGPLLERGHEALARACLDAALHAPEANPHPGPAPARVPGGLSRTVTTDSRGGAWRRFWGRRVVLDGVGDALFDAARAAGIVHKRRYSRPAPCVDLRAPGSFLDGLSRNTRYQLRRSARQYEARGVLRVRRADTAEEALAYLDALRVLHQAAWRARGQPGVLDSEAALSFHRALVARGVDRGEVDLLRVTAGEAVLGYLYNFRHRGRVLSYQSGFDYAGAGPHQKPGLTCHHLAIEMYRAEGAAVYDFLAGPDRYKLSLGGPGPTLHWVDLVPRRSVLGLAARVRDRLDRGAAHAPVGDGPPAGGQSAGSGHED